MNERRDAIAAFEWMRLLGWTSSRMRHRVGETLDLLKPEMRASLVHLRAEDLNALQPWWFLSNVKPTGRRSARWHT